jgi:hypothetical protein
MRRHRRRGLYDRQRNAGDNGDGQDFHFRVTPTGANWIWFLRLRRAPEETGKVWQQKAAADRFQRTPLREITLTAAMQPGDPTRTLLDPMLPTPSAARQIRQRQLEIARLDVETRNIGSN